ncbi:hypothetical protein NVE82_08915, partial [Escherichia coli]|nr:hypothetical protein [Escherichia coli]
VHHPQTEALLWQHETRHAYNAQGLANRCIPDSLPAVEWLAYGSGYLAGMKLGDTPLVDFTRDRLHRETLRSFGRYELTTAYTPAGQLQSQHLNSLLSDRDYTWNDNGELIRISSPRQTRSTTGRLTSVHTTAANLDIRIPYATDPAGNRLPDPELHPDSTLSMWPDNRIARDAHYLYRYDRYGRLTEKTDLIPEGVIRTDDERTHRYHYDSQHRLVHYTRTQYEEPLVESRYLYDPLGRRVAKRVWRRERDLTGWMSLSRKPQYHYDSQHRLVHYTRTQYAEPLVESRYLYDPLGRRVAKRVWRRERDLTGWMSLSRKPQYHYDSQHRLVHYTRTQYEEPLVESRYLYDPLGRRVAKRVWRRERDLTGWMSLSRKP